MGEPVEPTSSSNRAADEHDALEESLLGSFENQARRRRRLPILIPLAAAASGILAGILGDVLSKAVSPGWLSGGWRYVPVGLLASVYLFMVLWRPIGRRARTEVHDIAVVAADDVWNELSLERRAGTQYRGSW